MLRAPFVLLRNLFVFLAFLWSTFWYKVGYFIRRKKKLYIAADLENSYQFGPQTGLARYMQETPSFLELRDQFDRLEQADDIDGLVVATNGMSMGMARAASLGSLIGGIRESGKHVVAQVRQPTTAEYLLATEADDLLMTPAGRLYTFGPRFDQFFAAETLDRIGVDPQLIHIGDFKTASHRMIHREMTPAQKAMMESLYASLTGELRERVAQRRAMDESEADRLFSDAPLDMESARAAGLVDHAVFRGRLEAWLRLGDEIAPAMHPPFPREAAHTPEVEPPEEEIEEAAEPPGGEQAPPEDQQDVLMVALEDADSVLPPKFDWKPVFSNGQRFAVMDLTGMIVMPGMTVPGRNAPVIDPDEVMPKLREIRESGIFSGLLLHINSPGGSALASDIIWEGIQRVRQVMPVVSYCTDVAGSGGYYLSVAADEVLAHRLTMTGSIGVVTGTFSAPDIADRVGVNVESIYEHEADTFTSLVHPLGDEMMERLNEDARQFYRRFLERVGQSRGLEKRRLHRYARGRVYFGEDAHRRGLVDQLGGFDEAVRRLGELSDLDPDTTDVSFVPHREPSLQQLVGMSGQARSFVPDELVEPVMAARVLEREHMLALMDVGVEWQGKST